MASDWEHVEKKGPGARALSKCWYEGPAVSFSKQALSFNAQFMKAFGFKEGDYVCVFRSVERRKVGFKSVLSAEDQATAFKIRLASGKGTFQQGVIACKNLLLSFPDVVKKQFAATMSRGESIIEVDLGPAPEKKEEPKP